MAKQRKRFVRIRGRIIPIGVRKEMKTAGEIFSGKNAKSLAIIAGSLAGYGAGVYGAGRLHRKSNALMRLGKIKMSNRLNTVAKLGKFGVVSAVGLSIGGAILGIDKRTNDERSRLFSIGSQAKTVAGHALTLAATYGAYRLGKRFEYAGKMGKNLLKLKDIKSMKKLRAL